MLFCAILSCSGSSLASQEPRADAATHPWGRWAPKSYVAVKESRTTSKAETESLRVTTLKELKADGYALSHHWPREDITHPGTYEFSQESVRFAPDAKVLRTEERVIWNVPFPCRVYAGSGPARKIDVLEWRAEGIDHALRWEHRNRADGALVEVSEILAVTKGVEVAVQGKALSTTRLEGVTRHRLNRSLWTLWESHEVPGSLVKMVSVEQSHNGENVARVSLEVVEFAALRR